MANVQTLRFTHRSCPMSPGEFCPIRSVFFLIPISSFREADQEFSSIPIIFGGGKNPDRDRKIPFLSMSRRWIDKGQTGGPKGGTTSARKEDIHAQIERGSTFALRSQTGATGDCP